jgi:hypothetical protein
MRSMVEGRFVKSPSTATWSPSPYRGGTYKRFAVTK